MSNFANSFTKYELPLFELGVRLPEIKIPIEEKINLGLKENSSNSDYLKKLCWKKCQEKILSGKIKQSKQECIDRLKIEFDVFDKTGTVDYLLLLIDIVYWANNSDILLGPGRGSSSGSFSLFCLDIVKVNPLDYGLYFSRFLSEARSQSKIIDKILYVDGKSMCDVDIDVEYLGRTKLLERIERDYSGKSCHILTLQVLTGKMSIKETCKILLEYDEGQAINIGSMIDSVFGKVDSLIDTHKKNKTFREWTDINKEAYLISQKIEGLLKTNGIHASGILLSHSNLDQIIPKELSSTDLISTGFDMNDSLTIAAKIDLLGLKNLDNIKICCKLAGIKVEDIDINHESIYRYLNNSKLFYNVFQLSEGLTKEACLKVRPKNIEQISAILAISRPGSFKHIDDFAKYCNTGERKLIYPAIDDILKKTGNIIIYQEQINQICQEVYKLSAIDSDSIRYAIGKKKRDEIKKWEPILYLQGDKLGIPKTITEYIWVTINNSADYLFNFSHSLAYSYITAYTAYLKCNYPKEFYLSSLMMSEHESDPTECIKLIQGEMKEIGMELLPPDILKSSYEHCIEGNGIRLGLAGIKGLSTSALDKLKSFKSCVNNKIELFSALNNAKIPLNICNALIMTGSFQSIAQGTTRQKLVAEIELYKLLTPKELLLIHNYGAQYNYDIFLMLKELPKLKDAKGKLLIKESRIETIRKNFLPYNEKYKRNSNSNELCDYLMELEFLGFSFSQNLKNIYSKQISGLINIRESIDLSDRAKYKIAAIINEVENRVSRAGKVEYQKIVFSDETGTMGNALVWGKESQENLIKSNGRELKGGDLCIFHCSKKVTDKDNMCYVNDAVLQINPIIIRKSQIEKELLKLDTKEQQLNSLDKTESTS